MTRRVADGVLLTKMGVGFWGAVVKKKGKRRDRVSYVFNSFIRICFSSVVTIYNQFVKTDVRSENLLEDDLLLEKSSSLLV